MKEKFLAALKTEWSRLGLKKEALDRVASQRAKTIEKEEDIAAAVKDAETMSLLMTELQSSADSERNLKAQLQKDFDDYKTKHPESDTDPDNPDPDPDKPDVAKIVADAIAKAVAPLTEKITSLENNSSAKEALATAKDAFFKGDYAKKYKSQAEDAWERAVEMNDVTGKKMTADELNAKATGYFNASVAKLGVDTSKPFVSDNPDEQKGTMDWSAEKKRLQDAGRLPKDEN